MDLLRRPEINYPALMQIEELGPAVLEPSVAEQIDIQAKYEGYLTHQLAEIDRQKKYQTAQIPSSLDYNQVTGLSNEVRQKLNETKPTTLGQASRIPGITPAAISLLLVHLKKKELYP